MDSDALDGLDPANRAAVLAQLSPGETLVWAAQPSGKMQLAGCAGWVRTLPFMLFGLLCLIAGILNIAAGVFSMAFLLFFIGVGVPCLIVGIRASRRMVAVPRDVRRTAYALTDKRLIRVVRDDTPHVEEVALASITSVSRTVDLDGSGSLTIQAAGTTYILTNVRDAERGYRSIAARTGSEATA
jgi:hypothetical protein